MQNEIAYKQSVHASTEISFDSYIGKKSFITKLNFNKLILYY